MAEVKVLLEGFLSSESKGKVRPTICLVRDKKILMITDPGITKNSQTISNALEKEGLKLTDINYIFLTHSHFDHYRNIGLFPQAKIIEYFGIWENDNDAKKLKENFTRDIKIIKTPGHSSDSLTMLVKTSRGIVAICGDVFWKENFPKNDLYAQDKKELLKSRKLVKKLADYIIPGHGKMFTP